MARQERIALPSELAVASGSRLDPKSLQREERNHLVLGLALRRLWHTIVIAPRSASIQVLFLKVVFVFWVQAGVITKMGVVARGS